MRTANAICLTRTESSRTAYDVERFYDEHTVWAARIRIEEGELVLLRGSLNLGELSSIRSLASLILASNNFTILGSKEPS